MTALRNLRILAVSAAFSFVLALSGAALASPNPPTEGGNGGGSSGQCTGANADRPASCQSRGGPGDQP